MKTPVPLLRRVALTALVLLSCSAYAQDGLEVGVGLFPTSGVVANARVALPLFDTDDVTHGVRADVSYAFEGAPALAATYLLNGAPEGDPYTRYLGAGLGVAFETGGASSIVASAHGLAGVRIPIAGGLHAFTEAIVAGNGFGASLDLGVGVAYTFGGDQ